MYQLRWSYANSDLASGVATVHSFRSHCTSESICDTHLSIVFLHVLGEYFLDASIPLRSSDTNRNTIAYQFTWSLTASATTLHSSGAESPHSARSRPASQTIALLRARDSHSRDIKSVAVPYELTSGQLVPDSKATI